MSTTTAGSTSGTDVRPQLDLERVGAFAQQVAAVITGGATTALMVVGDRLGLYAALAQAGPSTPASLAGHTNTAERYIAEWLAQQTAVGFIIHDSDTGRFSLPPEHAAVLATDDSPASLISAASLSTGMHRRIDEMTEAFRTGNGLSWAAQDATIFDQTERFFRVGYRANLVPNWIPALDGVHDKLTTGASVADIGCGRGAPMLLLAEAYPASRFVGYDSHPPSIDVARERVRRAGLADRVTFEVNHAEGYPRHGYDLVTFFDTLHDLGNPGAAAAYARGALAPDGTLMLVEPRAADDLDTTVATVPTAALGYAASTFLCVPNSLSQRGAAALGAHAGERRLREILLGAGFSSVRLATSTPFNLVIEARP